MALADEEVIVEEGKEKDEGRRLRRAEGGRFGGQRGGHGSARLR